MADEVLFLEALTPHSGYSLWEALSISGTSRKGVVDGTSGQDSLP